MPAQITDTFRQNRRDGSGGVRHEFHRSILREYDIRGVVGETLGEADAYALGRAFGHWVAQHSGSTVAVCRDGRHSSPALEASLVAGLADSDMTITRIGVGPTPMLYFATHHLGTDAGIMVTGSHNPPDQNGFKMVFENGPVFGPQIQEIGRLAGVLGGAGGPGDISDVSITQAYIDRLVRGYDGARALTVAWDAANGATGEVLAALLPRLPGKHLLLNERIDGSFPAHHPDPTVPENLVQLQEAVRQRKCDLGIGFDGDGDRIGIVDERGRILWGDQILALLARDVLRRHPGATIIADVKASQTVFDEIARLGGIPLMWTSGHSRLRRKLAEVGSPLAGEMSGHIFYGDGFYGHDDAIYAAIRFLSMLSRADQSAGALRDSLPEMVNTPEVRFDCPDDTKFEVVEKVKVSARQSGAAVNDIDGVRVTTGDGWWLLRASNTQPMLVARCEAHDSAGLERLKVELGTALRAAGVASPL